MLENHRELKNSPNLLLLFVKITKFLEFSEKNNSKNYSFFELCFLALPTPTAKISIPASRIAAAAPL